MEINVKESFNRVELGDFIISITRTEPDENVAVRHFQKCGKSQEVESEEEGEGSLEKERPEPKCFPQKTIHVWTTDWSKTKRK